MSHPETEDGPTEADDGEDLLSPEEIIARTPRGDEIDEYLDE